MKQAFKLLHTTFLVFLTTMVFAGHSFDFSLESQGNKCFVMHVTSTEEKILYLTIKNPKEEVVFIETIAVNQQNEHKINLEELAWGEYVVLLEDEQVIQIQPFVMTANDLQIAVSERQSVFKPFLSRKHDFVDLNMLCMDLKVQLRISDTKGHVIYSEILSNKNRVIEKRFNLSLLDDGAYKFTVKIMDVHTELLFDKDITISQQTASSSRKHK